MGKSSRTKARSVEATPGEVGPRQPCPCGSGKRYKACHGAPGGPAPTFVNRPFEGLPSEFPPLRTEADLGAGADAALAAPPFYRKRTVLVGALAGGLLAAGGCKSSPGIATCGPWPTRNFVSAPIAS